MAGGAWPRLLVLRLRRVACRRRLLLIFDRRGGRLPGLGGGEDSLCLLPLCFRLPYWRGRAVPVDLILVRGYFGDPGVARFVGGSADPCRLSALPAAPVSSLYSHVGVDIVVTGCERSRSIRCDQVVVTRSGMNKGPLSNSGHPCSHQYWHIHPEVAVGAKGRPAYETRPRPVGPVRNYGHVPLRSSCAACHPYNLCLAAGHLLAIRRSHHAAYRPDHATLLLLNSDQGAASQSSFACRVEVRRRRLRSLRSPAAPLYGHKVGNESCPPRLAS